MLDLLTTLLDTSGFPPRWECGTWSRAHGWLHIMSDLGVWSAYLAIPCVLGFFLLRRRDIPFRLVFGLFGAFILACGTTHLMEAIIFWWPAYRLAGLIKLATALVSWATIVALVRVAPEALAMRTPEELEREIESRKRVEAELTDANQRLRQEAEERRQAERQVQASLAEKEVLLKEVHHRVKNNLQIISSLLDLQSSHTSDHSAVEMFRESQSRVRAMALVHERLYRSGELARVDFAAHVQSLADDVFHTYRVEAGNIRLDVQAEDDLRLPIDQAVPCSLLLNELLSNCLKHAFRSRDGGIIQVTLRRDAGKVHLSVADDGCGLPPHLDIHSAQSFGLQLVGMLVDQLQATLQVSRERGTTFRMMFPQPRPAATSDEGPPRHVVASL